MLTLPSPSLSSTPNCVSRRHPKSFAEDANCAETQSADSRYLHRRSCPGCSSHTDRPRGLLSADRVTISAASTRPSATVPLAT